MVERQGGRNAGELLKKYSGARVTAIDYSEISVGKATEYNRDMINAGRCVVKQGDVSALDLPEEFEEIIEGMKCYTIEDIEAALKSAGFTKVKADHHKSKPWITVLAKK